MRRFIVTLLAFTMSILCGAEGLNAQDRIETSGGAILTGRIEKVSEGTIHLATEYAGNLDVDLSKVKHVNLAPVREVGLPATLLQPAIPVAGENAAAKGEAKPKAPAKEESSPSKGQVAEAGGWKLEARLGMDGRGGSTQRFQGTLAVKAELERKYDRFNVHTRYTYVDDPIKRKKEWQPNTTNEIILGGQYTNFFYKKVGQFFREELERDRFEGVEFRSTTAAGLSYQFKRSKGLRLESRAGLSYRFESFVEGFDEEFPGMDFGFDAFWQFAEWGSFTGAYSYVPSLKRLGNYIFQQDSFVDLPLKASNRWKFRIGINSQYNSSPASGRESLDYKYYASLIASWEQKD